MVSVARDIVTDDLRTGDRLPNEAAMMSRYGVSRASLREAMRLLEVQGLVTLKPGPGGGAFVGSVDHRNLARTITLYLHMAGMTYRELMAAQEILESVVASSAAANPDHEAKQTAFAPFIDPPADPDPATYRDLSMGFHATTAKFALNRTVTLLARAVTHIVTVHVTSQMAIDELHEPVLTEHAELSRAICAGERDAASRLMGDHFRSQHDFLRDRWPDRFDDIVDRP